MLLGVELGGALINYTTTTTNTPYSNANQWNVGGFYDTPVSDYIHFTVHAGYTVYSPESSGATTTAANFSGMYAQLDITHRVNQYVDYSLSGGRTISVAFAGARLTGILRAGRPTGRIVRKVTLGTSFSYEHGTRSVCRRRNL